MTETQTTEQKREADKATLTDLSKRQRGLAERLRLLELERQKLAAQEVMQGLFVDIDTIVQSTGSSRDEHEVEYDGLPATARITQYDYLNDIVGVWVVDSENLLAGLSLTRSRDSKEWKAKLWITKDGRDEMRFGKKSGDFNDYPASDLFEGSKEWDNIAKLNKVNMKDGIQFDLAPDSTSIQNGLHPKVFRVADTVHRLAERLTTS